MIPKTNQLVLIFIFSSLFFQCGTTKPSEYEDFLTRLKNDEPYIQFFSTEESCISITTEEYFFPGMGAPIASLTKNILLLNVSKTFYDNRLELSFDTMMDQVYKGNNPYPSCFLKVQ